MASSLQRKMILSGISDQGQVPVPKEQQGVIEKEWSSLLIENKSYNGVDCLCDACPTNGMSHVALTAARSIKMLLQRIARVYLGSPVLLFTIPLIFGILIGVFFTTQWSKNSGKKNAGGMLSKTHHMIRSLLTQSLLLRIITLFWIPFDSCLNCKNKSSSNTSSQDSGHDVIDNDEKDEIVRKRLRTEDSPPGESGVERSMLPKHIAVIMDGNRRYGKARYGNVTRGHWDGSKTLVEFAKWCIAEGVQVLTVYAFSTENWNREPAEVASLMAIFKKYCDELRLEAIQRGIKLRVLSTETDRIPPDVKEGLVRMAQETKHCDKFEMNICLSYGSRGEMVNVCKSIAVDAREGRLDIDRLDESDIQERLLTGHCSDPDVLIRTSGEMRLSNFLLWQSAYSELFFLSKQWPELEKEDLLQVIRSYAVGRQRRFGK